MVGKKRTLFLLGFMFVVYALNSFACTTPVDNLTINNDTVLCNGTYNIADTGNGLIIINASGITLECNNTVLNGTTAGIGINISGFDNVTVKNCNISNYQNNLYLLNGVNINLLNNTFLDPSSNGIYFSNINNSNFSDNDFLNINSGSYFILTFGASYNNLFENNYATGTGSDSLDVALDYNWTIRNNHFFDTNYYYFGVNTLVINNVFNYSWDDIVETSPQGTGYVNNTFIDMNSLFFDTGGHYDLENNTFINITEVFRGPNGASVINFLGGNVFYNTSYVIYEATAATFRITKDSVLPQGNYFLNDSGTDGVIVIDASNIVLDCNNVLINGGGVGKGIVVNNKTNTTIKNCQLQNYTTDLDVLAVSNGTTIENMNISGYNITNSTVKFVYSSLGILNFLEAVTASGAHLNDGDVNATLNIASNLVSVRSDLVPGFNKSAEITIYNADSLSLSNRTPYLNGAECPANICTEIQDGDTYIFNVTHFTNYSVGGIPAPIINATLVNLTSSYQDARGKVYLDWTADTNLNVTKYNIYRSTTLINSTNLDSSKLLAANETGISYIDTSQKNTTTTYYYALTAVDKYGNENISAITNVVNETTLSTCTQTWGDWSSWNTCIAGSQKRSTSRLCYLIGVATTDEETQTCSSSSSSSGGGSISLDKVSITLAKIENGTETKVSITDDGFYLYEALVTLTKTHESVKFTFEKYDTKPTGTIGPKSDEKVFKYFQIKQLKGAEDLADATIKFKLTKKWISDNNLHPSYIRMYRFTTSWTELETTKTKEDSGNYYFEAKTPGFSYFKILALLPEEQAAQETAGNETIQEVSKTEEVDEVLADTIQETQGVTAANKTTEDEEKSVSAVKWVFPVLIVFSLLIIAIATAYAIRLRGIDDDDDEDDEEDEPKEKRHHHHKKRKKHHHTTHAKNQSEEKILRFLETGKERGHSDHSMLKKLKDTGWKKEIVGRAYDKLKNKHK